MSTTISVGLSGSAPVAPDPDEALCTRLRDLALVDLESLVAGARAPQELIGAYADDVADALREARTRIAALRTAQSGPDPLLVLDLPARQRASDTATAGATRTRQKLVDNAAASRSLARLSELAAPLVNKLFEADRRRWGPASGIPAGSVYFDDRPKALTFVANYGPKARGSFVVQGFNTL